MNFNLKLKLYRYWNKKQVDENENSKYDFEKKWKKKFSDYFRKHYAKEKSEILITLQFIMINDKIMYSNNATNIN